MAVIKEWVCMAHGIFESSEAKCPHGCTTVERHFKTAHSIGSDRTRGIDKSLTQLADDYNMTDISNKNGTVMSSRSQDDFSARWVSPTDAQKQIQGRQPMNALTAMQGSFQKPEAMIPASIKAQSAKDLS